MEKVNLGSLEATANYMFNFLETDSETLNICTDTIYLACEEIKFLREENEKLRKVAEAARKIAYVNSDGHGMRSSNSRDYFDLDKLIKEWKGE